MFDGEYLNGERMTGKESYYTGDSVISLEYSNGKKIEEKGKEYFEFGGLK